MIAMFRPHDFDVHNASRMGSEDSWVAAGFSAVQGCAPQGLTVFQENLVGSEIYNL